MGVKLIIVGALKDTRNGFSVRIKRKFITPPVTLAHIIANVKMHFCLVIEL